MKESRCGIILCTQNERIKKKLQKKLQKESIQIVHLEMHFK